MNEPVGGGAGRVGTKTRPDHSAKARLLLVAGLAFALVATSLALAACGAEQAVTTTGPGQASSSALVNTVSVSGQATVTSPPDEAVVVLTVENDAANPTDAMNATSTKSQQMLDRLKSEGIPESAIQTSSITLYPVRSYDPDTGKESLTGYRAQNSVKVTLKDAPTVGKVLAVGVETGATLVSGPDWRLRDDSQAVSEALKRAVANARSKAESLAAAGGFSIGEVLIISEGAVQVPVPPIYGRAEAADSSKVIQPPVSPGTLDVTATVTVTYELKR